MKIAGIVIGVLLLAGLGLGRHGGAPGMNGDLQIFPHSHYVIVVLSNLDPPAASRISDFIVNRLPQS